jgi:hypothetical protein
VFDASERHIGGENAEAVRPFSPLVRGQWANATTDSNHKFNIAPMRIQLRMPTEQCTHAPSLRRNWEFKLQFAEYNSHSLTEDTAYTTILRPQKLITHIEWTCLLYLSTFLNLHRSLGYLAAVFFASRAWF